MKPYLILLCAVILQTCLGATYAWSVFVQPLKDLTGLQQGMVQLPFTLFYFAFPAVTAVAGLLLSRIGPRRLAVYGGVLFGGGWLLASMGDRHFLFTVLGIGLTAGLGVGMAYIVPIAVGVRWFPNHKGLVTGIAVAGFGGGAALISQCGGHMVTELTMTPFSAFGVLGLAFMVLVCGAGAFLQFPRQAEPVRHETLHAASVLGHKTFRVLYLAMFAGLAAGFTVNANLREFFADGDSAIGVTAVSLFAVANALGRILWGFICDLVRPARAIVTNLALQAAVLCVAPWLLVSESGYLAYASLAGFNYGGVLVIYASSVAGAWRVEQVGRVYGLLFTANIPAAAFPVLAGMVYDYHGNFGLALWIHVVMLVSAAALVGRMSAALRMQGRGPCASDASDG
jgi:OFA family oxalate/formate antiporter-like MFS transporter